jgi:MraZ protein
VAFGGIYQHAIDAKSRLAIPSDHRKLLPPSTSEAGEGQGAPIVWVSLNPDMTTLSIWPEARFDERAKDLDKSRRPGRQLVHHERLSFAYSNRVEVDKQGRVRIPEHLLEMTKIGSEVTVIGANDHMEVWDRQAWQEYTRQMLPQGLLWAREAAEPVGDPGQ